MEMIDKIIEVNPLLANTSYSKINVGFTNTIYSVGDYIVKICTDKENENEFIKEINFYNSNSNNSLIPKLYYSDITKKDIPYYYEIMEKVKGVSLYNVWHTYSEEEREDIIRQLCDAMKMIHSTKGTKYDWPKAIKTKFNILYSRAKELNIFSQDEIELLDQAYLNFDKYLESDEFVLVHNDLHFDNIFVDNKKIKIIDFERSLYAPRDYELDILYRMVRKPWKFASEETEDYTDESQYKNIMSYIGKYYPELVSNPYLYERLGIYDIVYFMAQLIRHPELEELKMDVLKGAEIVRGTSKTIN